MNRDNTEAPPLEHLHLNQNDTSLAHCIINIKIILCPFHSNCSPRQSRAERRRKFLERSVPALRLACILFSLFVLHRPSAPVPPPSARRAYIPAHAINPPREAAGYSKLTPRPKINSHEEEPSRRCRRRRHHPNRWLRRILWPEDKTFQPSFIPSLSFLGSFIPPGLSILLSCLLTPLPAPLPPSSV